MSAEHSELPPAEPRSPGENAFHLLYSLADTELIEQHPGFAEQIAQLIAEFEAIHTDGKEWDRRALVMRYDQFIVKLLTLFNLQPGAVDET